MAQEYFSDLNYTLSNEDTQVEFRLLPENSKRVFSIAGSGARCLPLIARNPQELHVVDMSSSQLYLCELRHRAAQALSYEEWLFLLGYRGAVQNGEPKSDSRFHLFQRLSLSEAAHDYWTSRREGWESNGFIRLGRWEKHFQKLGVLFRDYLRCDFSEVFEAQTLEDQVRRFGEYWPHRRWKFFLRIAASEYVFNRFLYKGHFSGSSEKRTEKRPPYQLVQEEFERVLKTQLARKNYFMQVLFLGKIVYEEGLPFEAHRSIFEAVKRSSTKVHYHCGNLLEVLPRFPFDFISLSDTISYLPVEKAQSLLQDLHPETPKHTRIVIRSFMKAPQALTTIGWQQLQREELRAHREDGTAVYQFHIFEKM